MRGFETMEVVASNAEEKRFYSLLHNSVSYGLDKASKLTTPEEVTDMFEELIKLEDKEEISNFNKFEIHYQFCKDDVIKVVINKDGSEFYKKYYSLLHNLVAEELDNTITILEEISNYNKKEVRTMTIKTSKYNEVAPSEIMKLIKAGAKIIKDRDVMDVGMFITKCNGVKITTMDKIKINNVILPLAMAFDDSYFNCEIEINTEE